MKLLPKRRSESGRIRELLRHTELPTLPSVVTTAIGQLAEPDVDMRSVAETVTDDAALSLRLLKTVNSATFAPRSPIETVHQAVMMLGRNDLESLLFSIGVSGALPKPDTAGFDIRNFWTTSGFRAGVAAGIADHVAPAARSESFTAALLQDMALPMLASAVDGYASIVASPRDLRLHTIEIDQFGWNHSDVGAWMAEEWGFPAKLADGIADHHAETDHAIMRAVSEIRGTHPDHAMDVVPDAIERFCAVPRADAEGIVEEGLDRANSIASLLL